MIDTVLFDLDGTLLCMDQDVFEKTYFKLLCDTMAQKGWPKEQLLGVLLRGVEAMVKNDGTMTNEERFWQTFEALTGKQRTDVEEDFLHFYENEFQQIRKVAAVMEESAQAVRLARKKGFKTVLATNPLFPRVATHSRLAWAGLRPEDFDWVTTYEDSHYCKPAPAYYLEVLKAVGSDPQHCLMVGNDTREDMCAGELGMQVYLVTDYLVDKDGIGTESFPHGTLHELTERLTGEFGQP